MWAAVHLDKDRDQCQRVLRNMDFDVIQLIFSTTPNQQERELSGLQRQMDWDQSPWKSCTVVHDDIYKQLSAKVYIFADSVLCLGGKE